MLSFKEYLTSVNMIPSDFAIKSKLANATIYKLCRGGKVRIDTAKRIVRVTKGAITLEDLGHSA